MASLTKTLLEQLPDQLGELRSMLRRGPSQGKRLSHITMLLKALSTLFLAFAFSIYRYNMGLIFLH